ncbi:MAG: DUF2075 domain-containing protein [Bacteroidetes bacterium]|jgi:hypothetical protein|nr:DUF2075 domain-containing protein [Bacteroidota bacterium]
MLLTKSMGAKKRGQHAMYYPQRRRASGKDKNKENNKSRMVAGYCWDWNSKKNSDEMDIVIPEHDFAKK